MPVTIQSQDIIRPAVIDYGNPINTGLIALFTVKNGVVTELVSGVSGSGSALIVDDANGLGWQGPVSFSLADIGVSFPLGKKFSYQVLGKFNAGNGAESDEPFIDFRTVDNHYLTVSANRGWNQFYPTVKGAWFSFTAPSLTVVDGQLTTIGGTMYRRKAGVYDAELYKDGTLTSGGSYAQLSSKNDLHTLTIGNHDETVYFVAIYDDHRTLTQFNEIDLNPNQVFESVGQEPSGTHYVIDAVTSEQLGESIALDLPLHLSANALKSEDEQVSSILSASLSSDVVGLMSEQLGECITLSSSVHLTSTSALSEQHQESLSTSISQHILSYGVASEQITQSTLSAIASHSAVTGVLSEQSDQAHVTSLSLHALVSNVQSEQLSHSLTVLLDDDIPLNSVPSEQISESLTTTLSTQLRVGGGLSEQYQHTQVVSLSHHANISGQASEQLSHSFVTRLENNDTVISLPTQQEAESTTVSISLHALASSVNSEQLSHSVVSSFKPAKEFVIDEQHTSLIKTTQRFDLLIHSTSYQPILTNLQFTLNKV